MSEATYQRLPRNVLPDEYTITLKPDLDTFKFEGSIQAKVKVHEATKSFKVDSVDLDVKNGTFTLPSGKVLLPVETQALPEENRLMFIFAEELPVGDGVFSCEFSGVLNENLRGFYRSKSKDANGKEVYYAVTQFEPSDARRAFPCWDEPAIKASFKINLIVNKKFLALSNMEPLNEKVIDDVWKHVEFKPTPKMSTYLVAVVVGNYDFLEARSKSNKIVRVFTPIGKKDQGKYALTTAVNALDFFEEYFKVPYPIEKADLIAIADFAAGAMENWGLITFREVALLYDPELSSTSRKQRIAETVSHELAHMWFGNLVTMEWWTYLWLNEGFACFMEDVATNALYPEYKIWNNFVYDTLNGALTLDALDSSHPIEVPIGHPAQIDEIFDEISYEKGASIVRMLENYIGTQAFREGLQHYLKDHSYSNTLSSDLWVALSNSSGKEISPLLDTWVGKIGFPVVSVTSTKEGDNVRLVLQQEKFYGSVDNPQRKEANQHKWKVPVDIAVGNSPGTKQILLEESSQDLLLENAAQAPWILINKGAVSYFRTMYTPEMLQRLVPAVKDKTLGEPDRLILHADLFALVKAGYRNTTEILKLTDAYKNETEYTVWMAIGDCMSKLNSLLDSKEALQSQLHRYGRELYGNIFQLMGWDAKEGEGHTSSLLRASVLNKMVTFNDENVLKEAKVRFDDHVSGKRILAADLRTPVYRAVARNIDDALFDKFIQMHKEAEDFHEEQNRIVTALGNVRETKYLKKLLEFSHSDAVRSQDSIYVIAAVSSSAEGRQLAWDSYKKNRDEYNEKYMSGFLMSYLLKSIAENFNSVEKAREVDEFFSVNAIPGTELTTKQIVENIMSNAKWLERDEDQMAQFFQSRT